MSSFKKLEVECVALSDEGRGIVRHDGTTFFVDNLLPGEKGIVRTEYRFGKLYKVDLVERLNNSTDRVEPLCKYYKDCGGCQLMHLDYKKELEYKRDKVKFCLHKFGHIDNVAVQNTIYDKDNVYNFRNKVQKPCKEIKGKAVLGFYKNETHDFIPIEKCLIETVSSQIISKEIVSLLNQFKYKPYNEDNQKGLIRHVLIKTSSFYNENLVCLVCNCKNNNDLKGINNFCKELVRRVNSIKSIVLNFNTRHTNVILGEKEKVVYGSGRIKDKLFDNDFYISSMSFYQTNSRMIETLYETGFKHLNLNNDSVVLDAYSGTGTIGLSIAKKVKKVYLVELNEQASKDSRENARLNNIQNTIHICEDCTKFILNNNITFDVVIMDPPRKGSTKEFLNSLLNMKPKQILYISCNPITLARDLEYLKEDYNIDVVIPVDMFPHSHHVETVVVLKKK